jgi:hypothetical protein
MSCTFTLEHYREILESALRAGYVFQGFHEPALAYPPRVLYLRHDLDVCLEEALDMADLEAKLGVRSTYFILVNSPVYNPLSRDSLKLVHQLQAKGHWIGLHVDPVLLSNAEASQVEEEVLQLIRFYGSKIPLVPVVSFHRPSATVLGHVFNSFTSTYSPQFFKEIKYISDSRGIWREGCPCQALSRGLYPAVQMLVHPIWWSASETEPLVSRLRRLLGGRLDRFKSYLGENIEPIGKLLQEGGL